ncbi:MAG: CatA-like O-acetyltransferase [Candidatus Bathyarchaeota archaeon]|uniref:CatA-like O-acetyltransferase n=1 Tax=Candidatus Bathycorpusculum sp. TaxID=2994959 RepID=UPI00282D1D99|nr:CatA-like O-acetyltransferase [Candidatus Termiticorpusculum sp.]MCL2258114.1 CatA-like O-acetyltransferase [Candidatus Termiticorpusculum sp.]MCL2291628.1 CatA-like O-acetyltransferase [Candidatus Termiticorpusculum sp.]
MKTLIDFQSWDRREYFEHFGRCADPYFGVTSNVDCTVAYADCKQLGFSFFVYYMFKSLRAVNAVENFRYRLIDNDVWLFDRVHASTTVGRPDNTFDFALFEYAENFEGFQKNAAKQIAQVQKTTGLNANVKDAKRLDVIHCTTLPWFSFTSFRHEKNIGHAESIPKIAFGKFFERQNRKWLPVSIHVNHGLADGYHIAKYLELFQNDLNNKIVS